MSSTFGIKKLSDIKNLKKPELTILELAPNEIKCLNQVRSEKNSGFSGPSLQELSDSIKAEGQHEPVIVRPNPDKAGPKYIMVAGERRLRAAEMAQLKIKAIVRDVSEEEARRIQLSENIHRENLSQLEVAQAVKDDLERLGSRADVSQAWNKSQQWVSQQLKYLEIAQGSGPATDAIKDNLTADRMAITTLGKLQDVNFERAIDVIEQLKADQKGGRRSNVRKAAEKALKEEKSLNATIPSAPGITDTVASGNSSEPSQNLNARQEKPCKTIKRFIQEVEASSQAENIRLLCSTERLIEMSCFARNKDSDDKEIIFIPDTKFSLNEAISYLLLHLPQSKCCEDFKCEVVTLAS